MKNVNIHSVMKLRSVSSLVLHEVHSLPGLFFSLHRKADLHFFQIGLSLLGPPAIFIAVGWGSTLNH